MIEVTYGSKQVKTEKGDTLYVVTTQSKRTFWSHELVRGGIIVDVQEKVAGQPYVDSKGVTKTYLKSGLNLNYIIGTALDAREINVAKLAVVECGL
jgi:hypothetical protein